MKPLGIGWPNLISIGRLLLLPVIVALAWADTEAAAYAAAAMFVVGALSDILDGYLARRHDMTTTTGAWLDPLSDKLFVATPLVALALDDRFPWWAVVVVIGRELAVSVLRWRLDKRSVSMPASNAGKLKTLSQVFAVMIYLLPLSPAWDPWKVAALTIAAVMTVYSGALYFLTTSARVKVS